MQQKAADEDIDLERDQLRPMQQCARHPEESQKASQTYRYHGPGRKIGRKHSGRRDRERWGETPDRRQLESNVSSLSQTTRAGCRVMAELTQTEDNHVDADDDGAHGRWEELADTAQHHNHTHRDVDEPTGHTD